MRTTVTLDDDLAIRLDHLQEQRRASFKEVLNEAVRIGLAAMETGTRRKSGVQVTRPLPLGRRLVPSLDNVAEAVAIGEGETHR